MVMIRSAVTETRCFSTFRVPICSTSEPYKVGWGWLLPTETTSATCCGYKHLKEALQYLCMYIDC